MRALPLFVLVALACGCTAEVGETDLGRTEQPLTCSNPYNRYDRGWWPWFPVPWQPDVKVGVVRYDAWSQADESDAGPNVLFKILPAWFPRAPFYAQLDRATGVWHGYSDRQEVADREIDYAYSRGIDYFAFLYSRFVTRDYVTGQYRPYAQLGNLQSHWNGAQSFELYQASTRCNRPTFALIIQPDTIAAYVRDWNTSVSVDFAWGHVTSDIVAQYQRPNVHTTPDGRPILYLYDGFRWLERLWNNDRAVARARLAELRNAFLAAGLPSPYIVDMDNEVKRATDQLVSVGFDAIGAYSAAAPRPNPDPIEVPFSDAVDGVRWLRNTLAELHTPMIPLVTTGWDSRPQVAWSGDEWDWYTHARPDEIAAELRDSIDFVKANPTVTAANSVLIYAWNELAEGGFLVPTLAEGSARLDAIAAARRLVIPSAVPSLAPVVAPTIRSIGQGCQDAFGMEIDMINADPDVVIETHTTVPEGDDHPIRRYTAPQWWMNRLYQCLTSDFEISESEAGLRVILVNPSRPSASAPAFYHGPF